jgi:hypothetical protein
MIVPYVVLLGLNKLLKLDACGYEQDWAVELADYKRVSEFIEVAGNVSLSTAERHAMVELILASYDVYITYQGNAEEIWKDIVEVLDANFELYIDILNYWALAHETATDDLFEITPLVRVYLAAKNN